MFINLLFQTVFGSFSYVFAKSSFKGENWWSRSSCCDTCKHPLRFFELIPIFSFLFLKGKCRYCQTKISKGHVLAEIIPLTFLPFFTGNSQDIWFIFWLYMAFILSIQDIYYQEIKPTLFYTLSGLLLISGFYLKIPWHLTTFYFLLALGLLWLFLGQDKLGLGDVLLLFVWGPFLTLQHLAIFFLIASFAALPFALQKKACPFIPFLSFALWSLLLWCRIITQTPL